MKRYKLKNCCKFIDYRGKTPEKSEDGYRLITAKNVKISGYCDEPKEYIPLESYESVMVRGIPRIGDILFTTEAPLGNVGRIPEFISPFAIGQRLIVIQPNEELLDYQYMVYKLRSSLFQEEIFRRSSGSTVRGIRSKELIEIEIEFPALLEQRKISNILLKLEQIIELRKKELQKLDELIKSRFVELFGEPMTNSKGYELKSYGELFELNAGGTPSKQKPEYWDNGSISWIGSNMCQNTIIYENDGNYITEEGLNHSSARMFPVDTVLIALVGATIGKTALLKFETTTNQNVLGVRGIRESGYTPEFIFYYTQGLYQKFLSIGDGGFAMASKGFISELPVPVIDLELQEQFTAFARQVDKSKVVVQKALDEAQTLFDSLMQEYFE